MAVQAKTPSKSKEWITVLLLLILSKVGVAGTSFHLLPPCQLFRALGITLIWKVINCLKIALQ